MADRFDQFLAQELRPPAREPDRMFVGRVQAHIRLEQRLQAERRKIVSALGIEMLGLAAVAAAAFWIVRSPVITSFAGQSPAILLGALLAAFSFVVLLLSSGPVGAPRETRARAFPAT